MLGYGYGFDSYYMTLVLPVIVFAMIAQLKVNSTFQRFSRVGNMSGYTGAEVAKRILHLSGIYDVRVEHIRGNLTDHYDPIHRVLRLSDAVYSSRSVAAIGVAAHEVGHAIQHSEGYSFLKIRHSLFPYANFASRASVPLIFIGILLNFSGLWYIGILFFAITTIFAIVTLPVEFNASKRAIRVLAGEGILAANEISGAKKVLQAAALTYIASAAVSLSQLLRYILIFNGRRDD